MDEIINFDLPPDRSSIIKVIGVGGGGNNAVNHMHRKGIKDVNFVVCNTDAQALQNSPVSVKFQLGEALTEGKGAGSKPDIGRQAALESIDNIKEILLSNTSMVFITAGMGGGTGTGAAPVIAKVAKELGILTVAIATIPFRFEGPERINQAIEGINELKNHVDSLLIINNEKLREIHGNLKVSEAFAMADDVLAIAAKGIAEIITVHGYINVDFADVETVMSNSGVAIMGSDSASGENRAQKAIAGALRSPLLNNNEITGARSVLLNITSGVEEITMDEISEITDYVVSASSKETTLIWGMGTDEELGDRISVTVIATGFKMNSIPELYVGKKHYDKIPLRDGHKQKPGGDKGQPKISDANQKTLDFTIKEFDETEEYILYDEENKDENSEDSERKLAERVRNLKKTHEKLKEAGYMPSSKNDEIEELENVPAYVRKKLVLNDEGMSKNEEVSKYRLTEDDEKSGPKIRPDNSYLHDNVD